MNFLLPPPTYIEVQKIQYLC